MWPGFIIMQGHKYSHICNLWGKFFPAGMICTTTYTISIPLGEMYLHARMFCALAHTSSIPMGAINFYMQEQISIPLGEMYLHARMFCALAHTSSIPMGAINFFMQECFLHSLIPLLFKCCNIFYSHGCNVTAWNQFWAIVAKPVLWQLMILLPCSLPHTSSIPMGAIISRCKKFFCTCWYDCTNFYLVNRSLAPC